jgi:FkbM family methyltransferase
MNIHPTDYEARLNIFYEALLREGDWAVDVGAHSGRHSIPMAKKIGPTGKVLSFEPQPLIRQQLLNNVITASFQNRVCVESCALSNFEGHVDFTIAVDLPEESGLRKRHAYNGPTSFETISVPVRKLDSFEFEHLAFIKLDTEGAELDVALGASSTLAKHKPVVAFEFGAASYLSYHDTPELMHDFFTRHHYIILDILGQVLTRDSFVQSSRNQVIWDYIAIPSQHFANHVGKLVIL